MCWLCGSRENSIGDDKSKISSNIQFMALRAALRVFAYVTILMKLTCNNLISWAFGSQQEEVQTIFSCIALILPANLASKPFPSMHLVHLKHLQQDEPPKNRRSLLHSFLSLGSLTNTFWHKCSWIISCRVFFFFLCLLLPRVVPLSK